MIVFQGEQKYDMEKSNPFVQEDEEGEVASVAYRSVSLDILWSLYYLQFIGPI